MPPPSPRKAHSHPPRRLEPQRPAQALLHLDQEQALLVAGHSRDRHARLTPPRWLRAQNHLAGPCHPASPAHAGAAMPATLLPCLTCHPAASAQAKPGTFEKPTQHDAHGGCCVISSRNSNCARCLDVSWASDQRHVFSARTLGRAPINVPSSQPHRRNGTTPVRSP